MRGASGYSYVSLRQALPGLDGIPRSLRILFENVARRSPEALPAIRAWAREPGGFHEIPFYPARILMHDTTCGPALADLAALRDAVAAAGGDPALANPVIPVDLVIDHSVAVDHHATKDAIALNLGADFRRNAERYAFVKWATQALANFRVVPPGNGILHQLVLQFLASVVQVSVAPDGSKVAFPDTLLGTDSHTPMVNALGVLGWGVGGIEGQAAMLGQAVACANTCDRRRRAAGIAPVWRGRYRPRARRNPGVACPWGGRQVRGVLRSRGSLALARRSRNPGQHGA